MPIIRRSDCVPLPTVVCHVVAVVMLEIRVARCVRCVENVAWLCKWNAVGSSDDGHKDARNMLRYYWLPINHYLLQLVGFSFTYLSKMHGHSNIKFLNNSGLEYISWLFIYVSFLDFSQMVPGNQIILFLEPYHQGRRTLTDGISTVTTWTLTAKTCNFFKIWKLGFTNIFPRPSPRIYIKSYVGYTIS